MRIRPTTDTPTYPDREYAGTALAERLDAYADDPTAVVLGLVRGGVPVAAQVAAYLKVPLDALVVRKLGVPWAPEVAFGALGPGDVVVYNEDLASRLDPADMDAVAAAERSELTRREQLYRAGRAPLTLAGRTAIIVDDGLATGATARAAVAVARATHAKRVVVAVPVGSVEAVATLTASADEVICPLVPPDFGAVSRYYDDFRQVTDAEVRDLLHSDPH